MMSGFENSFFKYEDGTPLPTVNNDVIEETAAINRLKRMKEDLEKKWKHVGPLEREHMEKRIIEQRHKVASFGGTGMLGD